MDSWSTGSMARSFNVFMPPVIHTLPLFLHSMDQSPFPQHEILTQTLISVE